MKYRSETGFRNITCPYFLRGERRKCWGGVLNNRLKKKEAFLLEKQESVP